jgi:hypothetical protein
MIAVYNDNDLLMVSSVKPHISPGTLFMLLTVVHKLSTGENHYKFSQFKTIYIFHRAYSHIADRINFALEMRIAHIRTGID